jgi:gas vesicle protein
MLGFAVGAAAGVIAGLLLAPKTGAELRRQARESANRARGTVAAKYGHARQAVHTVVDGARQAFEVGRKTYKEARSTDRPAS